MLKIFNQENLSGFFNHVKINEAEDIFFIKKVSEIIDRVRQGGDEAILEMTKNYDKVSLTLDNFRVEEKEFQLAQKQVSQILKESISQAIDNVTIFHKKQLQNKEFTHKGLFDEKLSQKVIPLDRVAAYVPAGIGGETPLISTAIMNIIPAKLAGVREIILLSPPREDKSIHPALLYTLSLLGVKKIFKCGGAQAISAVTYGTQNIPKCDMVVGPGSLYVFYAKKLCFGDIMIDGLNGPSEIVIINDGTGNPEYIAADLMSQAEHAGNEMSVFISTSQDFINQVCESISKQIKLLSEKWKNNNGFLEKIEVVKKSMKKRGSAILVDTVEKAIDISNQIAPEHLELSIQKPDEYLRLIRNAGAIFLGEFAPEPIGDYIAGTNHVLPTNGSARFASPLSVDQFQKKMNIIQYSKKAFLKYAPYAMEMADAEKLPLHRRSMEIRLENEI